MILGLLINWRICLFIGLLVWVAVGSTLPQTSELLSTSCGSSTNADKQPVGRECAEPFLFPNGGLDCSANHFKILDFCLFLRYTGNTCY